jgi:hypothetical protein
MVSAAPHPSPEIVCLTKSGGPLTKEICLDENGKLRSDGSACIMARGVACRVPIGGVQQLGELIGRLRSDQAIALGSLRSDLPYKVEIATKRAINGATRPGIISRSADNIVFKPAQSGFALLDFDTKGMPADVAERVNRAGGFWQALLSVIPEFGGVAYLVRASTSAGLCHKGTGAPVPGSNGEHVYVLVRDVADSARFLKVLHDRCWLAGYGWMMVGAAGQMLERSIVDRMVGAPERLVFEGPPILVDPLAQSVEARRPLVTEGDLLDTLAACPPLTLVEKAQLDKLRSKAKLELGGKSAEAREEFIGKEAEALVKRSGMPVRAAREIIRKQCSGVLLPGIVLPFDDPELAGKTVADVLADPAAFEGETLADPLEGVDYGRCKAKIMRRADGTPLINSFAHGGIVYELKLDAAAIRTAMSAAETGDVVAILIERLLRADIDPVEEDALIADAKKRTGTGMRMIARQIKAARQAVATEKAKEACELRIAERTDPRPMLPVPAPDAPWLPVMAAVNEVLGKSMDRIPPARNVNGDTARVQRIAIRGTHAFVSANEDGDVTKEAPPQLVINAMSEPDTAEMIERHIDFVDDGKSVHLPMPFVKHYQRRDDDALPWMAAVATLPIVSANGILIHADGLDRKRGIVFNVDPALMKIIPDRKACGGEAVAEAMRYLLDEWLVDVATELVGKYILVALALTLIERSVLDLRPAFFVSAGLRGSGKTTAISMIVEAVTGGSAAASAWSPNEEERRKALLSYLMHGAPYILWDNIPRGTQISCPHIEKCCTSAFYADRKLGVSEMVQTSAASIHIFTGNNIGPKGDLASRSLQVRLDVERVDPENRDFKHPDPIGWTRNNRSKILRALYVILLGNPALDEKPDACMKTRFKLWWRLVGSAVEYASRCAGFDALDFGRLFLDQEADNEDATSFAEALHSLKKIMADGLFKAADVAGVINDFSPNADACIVRDFLFPRHPPGARVSPKAIGKRLKAHVGQPVRYDGETLVLKDCEDKYNNSLKFHAVCLDVSGQIKPRTSALRELVEW